jgi:hypothetical protein
MILESRLEWLVLHGPKLSFPAAGQFSTLAPLVTRSSI